MQDSTHLEVRGSVSSDSLRQNSEIRTTKAVPRSGIRQIGPAPADSDRSTVARPCRRNVAARSEMGQKQKSSMRANVFCFAPESRHRAMQSARPFGATETY